MNTEKLFNELDKNSLLFPSFIILDSSYKIIDIAWNSLDDKDYFTEDQIKEGFEKKTGLKGIIVLKTPEITKENIKFKKQIIEYILNNINL